MAVERLPIVITTQMVGIEWQSVLYFCGHKVQGKSRVQFRHKEIILFLSIYYYFFTAVACLNFNRTVAIRDIGQLR